MIQQHSKVSLLSLSHGISIRSRLSTQTTRGPGPWRFQRLVTQRPGGMALPLSFLQINWALWLQHRLMLTNLGASRANTTSLIKIVGIDIK